MPACKNALWRSCRPENLYLFFSFINMSLVSRHYFSALLSTRFVVRNDGHRPYSAFAKQGS